LRHTTRNWWWALFICMTKQNQTIHGIRIKQYDGITYFTTSAEEDAQFNNILLCQLDPEACSWRIEPVKLGTNRRPKAMMAGGFWFITTNDKEMESALAWTNNSEANNPPDLRLTIPPLPV
jgi:hypothetical protein